MTYIFFRGEYFYPIEIPNHLASDEEVMRHVALNPGTTRVQTAAGRTVWDESQQRHSAKEG